MITPPEPAEYAPFYAGYIREVGTADPVAAMRAQLDSTGTLLAGVREDRSSYRYAPDKWSIREIVGHLADTERVLREHGERWDDVRARIDQVRASLLALRGG